MHSSSKKFKVSNLNTPQKNEKCYVTKQMDSSIIILNSPENDVVLEALLYLTKFADIQDNNLRYLYQRGLLLKLLNLLDRNVCILRLAMRLISVLLTLDEVMAELEQDVYDDKIVRISNMYTTHTDKHVKQYCISALSKLTRSCRITQVIFNIDLFDPILNTIQTTTDPDLLEWTLEVFLRLLCTPDAINILPMICHFNISILLTHLENYGKNITSLSFEVIRILTYYCLDVFQQMFREAKLIEKMFEVLMDPEKEEFHEIASEIICNSMKSVETSNYFIESVEFLKFCQWVKTCNKKYHFFCISILEQLTRIPTRRQILFDFSVEDSILYFLNTTEKKVLNKTCEAISNMIPHKYCCERMATPVVLKQLLHVLLRKDDEDPNNEVALKTIIDFSRNNLSTLEIIYTLGVHKLLLGYLKKGTKSISEENFMGILEILYKMSLDPSHQEILYTNLFEKLLELFETGSANVATIICDMFINFGNCDFRRNFLSLNGTTIFVSALKASNHLKLQKNILLFIYNSFACKEIIKSFIHDGLIKILKEFPETLQIKVPLIQNILKLTYNYFLPLKLFDLGKLAITDKLENKFYLISGQWKAPFPFLENLESFQVSSVYTIYVVDYLYDIQKYEFEDSSETICVSTNNKISSQRTLSTLTRIDSSISSEIRRDHVFLKHGKLSPDPFLPRYIFHINKYIEVAETMEEKIKVLADYVSSLLCEPRAGYTRLEKIHHFKLHIETLKHKLGTSMIPIGFLQLGYHCERALLFKVIADKCSIPTSLVRGENKIYWNEVALFDLQLNKNTLKLYVVDLITNIGSLLLVGSRAANQYCYVNI